MVKIISKSFINILFLFIFPNLVFSSRFIYWFQKASDIEDLDKKIEYFTKAIEEWTYFDGESDLSVAYCRRGVAYQEKGEYEKALKDFNKAISLDKKFVEGYLCRGIYYSIRGDYNSALADFDKALEIIEKRKTPYFRKDRVLEGRPATGILMLPGYYTYYLTSYQYRYYSKSIDAPSEKEILEATIYFNRGIVYFHKGHYISALRDFNLAITLSKNSLFYCWRGFIYSLLGVFSSALADQDKAIELLADNEVAYINKGWIFFLDGRYEQAIQNIDKALSMKEKSDFFGLGYRIKIFIYKEKNDKENLKKTLQEAEKYFKKQIEEFPKNAQHYAELAEIYCDAEENKSQALDLAKKALEIKTDYITYYVLGRAYLVNNKLKEALDSFLNSLILNSENIFCLYWTGKLYKYYLNDQQKAKEYFLMCMRTNPKAKFIIDELKTLP